MQSDEEPIQLLKGAFAQEGLTFAYGRENTDLEVKGAEEQIAVIEKAIKGLGWRTGLVNRFDYTRNGNRLCVHDECVQFLIQNGYVAAPPEKDTPAPDQESVKAAVLALQQISVRRTSLSDGSVAVTGEPACLEKLETALQRMGWQEGLYTKKDFTTQRDHTQRPVQLTSIVIYSNRAPFFAEHNIPVEAAPITGPNGMAR